ncbi:FtsX-like permease family protein [Cryptosporangium minutisporangium]|uniref:ABC transporter permease n=1 Tax=Cryptosporangium minutisporangium TaxID=113569 RepID=A0ABP6T113_9ACTN
MFRLAIRSIQQRPGRLVATLLAAFLGSVIVMTFNSLHDTAAGAGVDPASAESLSLTGGVVGGYGTLLVLFAVASTLTVNVRQRGSEMELLRSTGATPGQISRMIVGEAAIVAVAGALLSVWPAMLAGRSLVDRFHASGQVAESTPYVFGPIGLGAGFAITVIASVGAAFLAVRRGLWSAAGTRSSRGRLRQVAGVVALLAGAGAVSATFAMQATDTALMAAPAYGAILLSIGLAVFSPLLLRALLAVAERPLRRVLGAGGHLAVLNLRRRADELAGILMPLVVFVGMATATLYLQAVESDAIESSGVTKSVEDKNLETLNVVVVGIIAAFSCLMLVNALYAATSYRRQEFGQQRLAGATPGQVLRMVGGEAAVLSLAGVLFGTTAGVAGILSFTLVRTDALRPDVGPGIWLGIVAIAAVATLATSLGTAIRTLRAPAISTVAA